MNKLDRMRRTEENFGLEEEGDEEDEELGNQRRKAESVVGRCRKSLNKNLVTCERL